MRAAIRGFGELLITLGVIVLLFVAYELLVTDWITASKQAEASKRLAQGWTPPPADGQSLRRIPLDAPLTPPHPQNGQGFARIYIPAFGPDYTYTVLEGTSLPVLARGPGHYTDTAMPGEQGNFALAAHRDGNGSPFNDLDVLNSCDAVVIETERDWFVYRVLPMPGEQADWNGKGSDPRCRDVRPLGGQYSGLPGRHLVAPSQGEVILPVPGKTTFDPTRMERLITLTTCHPRYIATQRMIVHGVLTTRYAKTSAAKPPELPGR